MLTIRLQRVGKKNFATYRLIISEKARDTQGRVLENLGDFNPHAKEGGFVVKADRIKYWLSQGAQTSDTVHNLFLSKGLIAAGPKKKSVYISKKRAAKLEEKKKANEPKAAPAAEPAPAPVTPVIEPTPAPVEAPKEEPKIEAPVEPAKTETPAPDAPTV